MTDRALRIENASYSYRRIKALQGLSLEVETGSVVGLLGPNGAGKSTLMYLLNGITKPSSGLLSVLGFSPFRERVKLQKRIAYAPEHPSIYPWISLKRLRLFYHACYPGWDADSVAARLDEYGISLRRKFGELSRGQKGLVSLAVALGRKSDLLLLDDPTLGLDVPSRKHLYRTLVEELSERNVTIVFSTHLPAEVEGILTHAAFIDRGRILLSGPVDEIKRENLIGGEVPSLEDLSVSLMESRHVS
jgi:ABC-2 type transport system ATP-binding protein